MCEKKISAAISDIFYSKNIQDKLSIFGNAESAIFLRAFNLTKILHFRESKCIAQTQKIVKVKIFSNNNCFWDPNFAWSVADGVSIFCILPSLFTPKIIWNRWKKVCFLRISIIISILIKFPSKFEWRFWFFNKSSIVFVWISKNGLQCNGNYVFILAFLKLWVELSLKLFGDA